MAVVAVDFDHTLADTGAEREPGYVMPKPMPGGLEKLKELGKRHTVIVFTARAANPGGKKSVEDWLKFFGVADYVHMVTAIKFPFIQVYLDDRAIQFRGWDTALQDIENGIQRTTVPKTHTPGNPYNPTIGRYWRG